MYAGGRFEAMPKIQLPTDEEMYMHDRSEDPDYSEREHDTVDEYGNDYHALCVCGHVFTDHAIHGEYHDECQVCECSLFRRPGEYE